MTTDRSEVVQQLEELILALDHRVARVEQAGEVSIAREAAQLRAKAVRRLAELTRTTRRTHREAHEAHEKVLGFPPD